MKPYYEQLFDELVPAGFTARQKSDFLYFCKEYCEILNGKNADFIGIIKKNDGEDSIFSYYIGKSLEGIEVQVYKYNDETSDWGFIQKIVFENVLKLFIFFKEKNVEYIPF